MSVYVQTAGLIVDAFELDDAPGDILLINRSPAPDENDVAVDASISLDIAATDGGTVDTSTIRIYVTTDGGAEVLAYHGGTGAEPGFTATTTAVDANTFRVVVSLAIGDWSSESVVTVRATASTSLAAALDESYSFTIEDRTAPRLLSAVARSKRVVRITFDEAVRQSDAAAVNDALNPANYSFGNTTVPSVAVEAESVATVSDTTVDVTVDLEWTFGADYSVTATGLEDTDGNAIAAPDNTADFTGFEPDFPAERDFDLWRMIPQSNRDADVLDELRRTIAMLQDIVDLKLCEIDEWTNILDVDVAPEAFLDAMLDDLGNPFDFELDEDGKRRLIRVLVAIYQQKGTAVGIINVVRFFLGIETTITAWGSTGWILGEDELGFDVELGASSARVLYSYEISTAAALTSTQLAQIREIAEYMQPAHTHLVDIVYPGAAPTVDHLELGLSELGPEWILH